jgi:hypothetical protein
VLRCENPKCLLNQKSLDELVLGVLYEVPNGAKESRLELLARVILDEAICNRNTRLLIALLNRLWPKPTAIHLEAEQPVIPEAVKLDLSCLSDEELQFMLKIRKKLSIANADAPQGDARCP